jgi:hypothetical protein
MVPRQKIYFPITDTSAQYASLVVKGKLNSFGKPAIKAIDAIKPYKGGNDALWELKELNNIDKHRLLLALALVHAAHAETNSERQQSRQEWTRKYPSQPFPFADNIRRFVPPKLPTRPLKAGDELFAISESEVNKRPHLLVEVAFWESGVIDGERIGDTLHRLSDSVEKIVKDFRAAIL